MRRFAFGLVPFGVVCVGALVACTGLIGVHDIFLDADAAAGPYGQDATTDGGPSGDGATGDAATPCTANTTSDPANCGACGHDCLGGGCDAGKCQPVQVVFNASTQPYGLAVDGQQLYYSDVAGDLSTGGSVYRVDKTAVGGTGTLIAKTADPLIYDLVFDGAQIYITSGSVSYSSGVGILETFLPDGGARRTISKGTVRRGLSVGSLYAYWATPNDTPVTIEGVAKTAVDAGATTLVTNENGADITVVSGANLFWTDYTASGAVRRCTLAGAPGSPPSCSGTLSVHPTLDSPQAIATNSSLVIYGAAGLMYAQPKTSTGGTPLPFAKNQPQTAWIVADDNDVYWVNTGTNDKAFANGDVRHCPIVSGQPACAGDGDVLATSTHNPRVLVMDQKAIYWTVQYEGAVWRLAR